MVSQGGRIELRRIYAHSVSWYTPAKHSDKLITMAFDGRRQYIFSQVSASWTRRDKTKISTITPIINTQVFNDVLISRKKAETGEIPSLISAARIKRATRSSFTFHYHLTKAEDAVSPNVYDGTSVESASATS